MTQERFNRETEYYVAISAAREMLASRVISDADFSKIQNYFIKKYRPFFVE